MYKSITKRFKKYWSEKNLWNKLFDLIFFVLLISLLFPSGRMAVGGFVNNIKAKLINPSLVEEVSYLKASDYNWKLLDQKSNEINLEHFEDKVLFINLWATWCPPCIGEMPEIQKLYKKFEKEKDVEFLLISNEGLEKIQKFIDAKHYDFPVYASISPNPEAFLTASIPTTFIISKNGEIIVKEIGAANWSGKKMVNLLHKLINEN